MTTPWRTLYNQIPADRRARIEASMSWNYRVVRYTVPHLGQAVDLFAIVEVYYNAQGEPDGYCTASVDNWDTLDDLQGTVDLMRGAFAKPILEVRAEDVRELERHPMYAKWRTLYDQIPAGRRARIEAQVEQDLTSMAEASESTEPESSH